MAKGAERIICAVDVKDQKSGADLVVALGGSVGTIKLGKEFFVAEGPQGVRKVAGGRPLFLDLKFHDIPNTVAGAVRSALHLHPAMMTIHASGGAAMMRAAGDAAHGEADEAPWILAVTVLTSMGDDDLGAVGQATPATDQVLRLAHLAQKSGCSGVICAPSEVATLRRECGVDFKLVTPGVRPVGSATGDQKRVMTPKEAIDAGADLLVIGRPITQAPDPAAAAREIAAEIA